ncbi:hypothetical protein BJ912DRAFT_925406 [Pholiota molesta]|nr:hypothetical protein BJ912DRAFT_925406 [Pholiota molesta]
MVRSLPVKSRRIEKKKGAYKDGLLHGDKCGGSPTDGTCVCGMANFGCYKYNTTLSGFVIERFYDHMDVITRVPCVDDPSDCIGPSLNDVIGPKIAGKAWNLLLRVRPTAGSELWISADARASF